MQGRSASPLVGGFGLLRDLAAAVPGQLVGGRYRARWFYLIAGGLAATCLPLILLGVAEVWLYLVVGLFLLWSDWRHQQALSVVNVAFASRANLPPGEQVRLRSTHPVWRFNGIEIIATDVGVRWGSRALADAGGTLGLTGRTEIDFDEITRVVRTGDEIRVWTRTDSYSVSIPIWDSVPGNTIDEWMAFLKARRPEAESPSACRRPSRTHRC